GRHGALFRVVAAAHGVAVRADSVLYPGYRDSQPAGERLLVRRCLFSLRPALSVRQIAAVSSYSVPAPADPKDRPGTLFPGELAVLTAQPLPPPLRGSILDQRGFA